MPKKTIEYRLRQQSLISELGLQALQNRDLEHLAHDAARLAAKGVLSNLAKVLVYRPETNDFFVYAGVGWKLGVVGNATIEGGLNSPAGYALHTRRPVISNHLGQDSRFRTPELLAEHGVDKAINVIIQGTGEPFGLLEADTSSSHSFDEDDVAFLQSLANVLASAHERGAAEQALERTVREKDVLLKEKETLLDELNHRVKNNLQVVSNLLSIETSRLDDPEARRRFRAVRNRVTTLGQLHQYLYRSGRARDIDFGQYLEELCANLHAFYASEQAGINIETDAEPVHADLDRAIPLALIVNELIANSTKHAFPEGESGTVRVTLRNESGYLTLVVADDGRGALDNGAGGEGRELVTELARQIDADIQTRVDQGMTITIKVLNDSLRAEASRAG
ncbi:histidine kinase dimerization/phosphoacceptor domain -containing protein [Salinisphaera sp. SPP-AMP-43]|uniref:sensor histidine kinase n=1 Tax=Salinisphaera sp. SPP-AMP-43 TaxID=3121288 RepID=UPI003C6E5F1B